MLQKTKTSVRIEPYTIYILLLNSFFKSSNAKSIYKYIYIYIYTLILLYSNVSN